MAGAPGSCPDGDTARFRVAIARADWQRMPTDNVPNRRGHGLERPDALTSHQKRTGDALFQPEECARRVYPVNAD
jgi:hypothetical protein